MKLWNGHFIFEPIGEPPGSIVDVEGDDLNILGGDGYAWNAELECYESTFPPLSRLYVMSPNLYLLIHDSGEPGPVVGTWRPE